MKVIFAQLALFLAAKGSKRNRKFLLRLFIVISILIALYSMIFHYIMVYMEGRHYSGFTGVYWALTVMSTLGFGDITFESDIGKVFTMIVLASGFLFFMLVLPFTFIRFIYTPWLDAQANVIAPKKLPPDTQGHVIIAGTDFFAQSIARRLHEYAFPCVLLLPDSAQAMEMYDAGFKVVVGELDIPATYEKIQAEQAAMIIALHDDMKNTNIAATLREVAPTVPLTVRINNKNSYDVLHLAGANHVFYFAELMGKFLARRIFCTKYACNIIGHFDGFCIAESPAHNTSLIGMSLSQSNLRNEFGLNVVGIWQGNDYMLASPDTIIDEGAVLLLAGTEKNLLRYNQSFLKTHTSDQPPVLILGGGTVGSAIAEQLDRRQITYKIVEKNPGRVPSRNPHYIRGSAADLEVLKKAGIDTTETVIVTTHDDDVNIYLTIYCRKLRPEIQIISRASLDRNVASLYSAGANLVVSQANMMANTMVNLLMPGSVFMLTEGLNIFRIKAPGRLIGKNLISSGIREHMDCNVIAIRTKDGMRVPPDPSLQIEKNDELILIGTAYAEKNFLARYK